MSEPTPVTEDGDVIGLAPATAPPVDEDITPPEPEAPMEPPALPGGGLEDPEDL